MADETEENVQVIWAEFMREITRRGWFLYVGDHDVQICIPGETVQDDRYIEVHSV
jgi:hypothetical protein